ncbi:MAG: hypothetical protein U1E76_10395 [Planctomycetota bacterium]
MWRIPGVVTLLLAAAVARAQDEREKSQKRAADRPTAAELETTRQGGCAAIARRSPI